MIVLDILNRILIIIFFMALLNIIRHGYYFIQSIISISQEKDNKYLLSQKNLVILGISIAYLLSTFITGIKI